MDTVKFDSKQVKVIAHRGLSGLETENTCPAFVAAGNRSYFGIETDVHKTLDGKFVILHDETLTRVSNKKSNINIEKSNYSDFENILLPDTDGSFNRRDIRIPLLMDYIKICKKYEKVCVLEVKNFLPEEDMKQLIKEITELDYINNVVFISFDLENCITLRKLLPQNKIQWLASGKIKEKLIKSLIDNRLDLDIRYDFLTEELVAKLHSMGFEVNCWTCDNKADAEKLVKMGVDYITTNILE